MNNPQERECFNILDTCIHIVAEKYGKPDITSWTNKDYLLLSSQLFRKTNVQISASTLKRLFGKMKTADRYYPQSATRNTLAQFAGFSDWDSFVNVYAAKTGIPEKTAIEENAMEAPLQPIKKNDQYYIRRNTIFGLSALALIIILSVSIFKKQDKTTIYNPMAQLICSNPTGATPHSAAFQLTLSNASSADTGSFTIDFGDGHTEQSIKPGRLFTHYYEVPGRFYALLKYKGAPCDTVPVYLITKGWTATASIQHDTSRVYPVGITRLSDTRQLEVTADEVYAAGVDTMRTFFVNFVNTKPLRINGDNFELNLTLTTSHSRPGVRCSQANLTLFGECSQDMVVFMKPGCVTWSELNFSEIKYSGVKADLSYLGANFENGGAVKLKVMNKKVELFINGLSVFRTTYTYPLKKIYGMSVSFAGIGSVDGLLLKDLITGETFSGGLKTPNSIGQHISKVDNLPGTL